MEDREFQRYLCDIYERYDREVCDIAPDGSPRAVVSLNDAWRFRRQELGRDRLGSFERDGGLGSAVEPAFARAHRARFDDAAWERVRLPHTWNAADAEGCGPGYWRGIGWYRARFRLDRRCRGMSVRLRIGAANQRAVVWLNGTCVGEHTGGYTGFELEIDRAARLGDRPNVLVVRVDNCYDPDVPPTVKTDCSWYGGLYRDVQIVLSRRPSIRSVGVRTPGVESGTPRLAVCVQTCGEGEARAVLFDPEGGSVAEARGPLRGATATLETAVVGGARLWSPDSPTLYRLRVEALRGGRATDAVELSVGFRWYRFDPARGFFLNGERLQIRGTCWHQSYPGLGIALPAARHREDMRAIKAMGVNFLRTSHYPHHDEILRAADEVGILVLEELPVNKEIGVPEAYTANTLRMLGEMVRDHGYHPSIVLWGLAGEVNAPAEIARSVAAACVAEYRRLDPDRPLCMHAPRGREVAELFDVVGYGFRGSEQTGVEGTHAERAHERMPHKTILDTEYAVALIGRAVHDDGPHSEEEGCLRHEQYLRAVNRATWCAGSVIWHQFDYHGETYDPVIPRVVSFGMADAWRIPKDVWHFYRSQWCREPVLHICGHWTWPGHEGEERTVKVYSNAVSVELKLDGVPAEALPRPTWDGLEHPPFLFRLRYASGTLRAAARFASGDETSAELATAGPATRLALTSSAPRLPYDDPESLAEIDCRVVDAAGRLVPTASVPVSFSLDGPGELLSQSWPPFGRGSSWYTVGGRTRILFRPNLLPGTATLRAYSPGLAQGRLAILLFDPRAPDDEARDLKRFREFPHGEG